MRDFRKILAWQKAHRFALDVYAATAEFPRTERFGLTAQLRRAASSVPANIAEGCGRDSEAELARYLSIAGGSASETEYHLLLSRDLGFLDAPTHERLDASANEVKRMLRSYRSTLIANS